MQAVQNQQNTDHKRGVIQENGSCAIGSIGQLITMVRADTVSARGGLMIIARVGNSPIQNVTITNGSDCLDTTCPFSNSQDYSICTFELLAVLSYSE
jgi:hypothetical protein